jgi:membrane associated rhomboid family serine protease
MSLPAPTLPRCYRHPDRETGRSCTRCGRPCCSECLTQAPVGSLCPECLRESRPDARTRLRWWNARQPALVTYAIIAVNVAVYIWTVIANRDPIAGPGTIGRGDYDLALHKLFIEDGQYYRLVSSGFLHFGILHIALNMFLLFQIGQMLEPPLGRIRFGLLYFAALLAGSAGALIVSPNALSGGASGAVFGLMAAAVVALHQRGINPLQTSLGGVFLINLLLTFTIGNISIGGHIGGIVGGGLCAVVMMAPRGTRVPPWATYVVPVVVGAAAVVVSLAVAGGA